MSGLSTWPRVISPLPASRSPSPAPKVAKTKVAGMMPITVASTKVRSGTPITAGTRLTTKKGKAAPGAGTADS